MSEKTLEVVARLRDEITPMLARVDSAMAKVTAAQAAREKVAASSLASMSANFSRTIRGVGAIMAALGTKRVIEQAFGGAAEIQRISKQIEVVIGSATEAEKVVARLRSGPADAILGLDQLAAGYLKLEAVGVPAAEAVTSKLANLAVLFQRDLSSVTNAYLSGSSKGLRELGVDIDKTGDRIVLTSGHVRIVTEKTDAAMRAGLLKLWEERFPEALAGMATTAEAKFAALKDAAGDAMSDIATIYIPWVEKALDGMTSSVEGIGMYAVEAADGFKMFAEAGIEHLSWLEDRTRLIMARVAKTLSTPFGTSAPDPFGLVASTTGRLGAWAAEQEQAVAQSRLDAMVARMNAGTGQAGKDVPRRPGGGGGTATGGGGEESALKRIDAIYKAISERVGATLELRKLELDILSRQGAPLDRILAAQDRVEATTRKQLRVERDRLRESLAAVEAQEGKDREATAQAKAFRAQIALVDLKMKDLGDSAETAYQLIDKVFAPRQEQLDAIERLREAQLDAIVSAGGGAGAVGDARDALDQARRDTLQGQRNALNEKIGETGGVGAEAARFQTEVALIDLQLAELDRKAQTMSSPWSAMMAGTDNALARLELTNERMMEFADGAVQHVSASFEDGFVRNFGDAMNGIMSVGDAAKATLAGVAQSIQQVILKLIAMKIESMIVGQAFDFIGTFVKGLIGGIAGGVAGGIGGTDTTTLPDLQSQPALATGGIVPGGLDHIPRAARGMLFRGPQVAIVGDNPSRVEAAVPLPNGREIPVELKGGSGGNSVSFTINAIDPRGVREMLLGEKSVIRDVIREAMSTSPSFRRAVRGS